MKIRSVLSIVGVLGAVGVVVVGWYLVSPLFIDAAIDEAFPFDLPNEAVLADLSADEMAVLEEEFMTAVPSDKTLNTLTETDREAVETAVQAAAAQVMSDKEMSDAMPADEAEWLTVSSGTFIGADSFHLGEGVATIFQQGEQRILRFNEFSVTNGPDLHVILSTSAAPTSHDDIGTDYIDLGSLKGNIGSQNYDIPSEIDLSAYQSVVIYCQPFHVVFSTARLN
jgi:hypothetical protein